MRSFLLMLLTLNPHTGEVLRSAPVGTPFPSIDDCMRSAVERGPQQSDQYQIQMLVCRSADANALKDRVAPGGQES